MKPVIGGIHHITAIASEPQRNLDFYAGFLGLRLVKKTVNFDDPGTYHFYFGDHQGRPGTILTFFPWPGARRGRQGAGQVTVVAYAVPAGALAEWQARAQRVRLLHDALVERFGEKVLRLYDPDGLPVELIETANAPAELNLFHAPAITLHDGAASADLLTGVMGLRLVGREGNRTRYAAGEQAVDVVVDPAAPRGLGGAGTVHHIAWRTPDDEQQRQWQEVLRGAGLEPTPVMDRNYFHSIYFREPGQVLYEIATDPPGFTVDEPVESLGTRLRLPEWYEPMRARIEAALPAASVPQPVR